MGRRLVLALGVVVALALAGLAALYLFVDPNQFRGQIAAQLEGQVHRPVSLGAIRLRVFPLSVRVDDLTIGERSGFATGRPFATASAVEVHADLASLLRGRLAPQSLTVVSPVVELVRSAGAWNVADLAAATTAPDVGTSPGSASAQGASGSETAVALDALRIDDGSVAVTDLAQPQARAVYPHLDVEVRGLAGGSSPTVKAAVQLPGEKEKGRSIRFEGTARAPLGGTLTVTGASLASLMALGGGPAALDGALSGTVALRSEHDLTSVSGRLDLTGATREGKALGLPMTLEFDVVNDAATDVARASKLVATAGKTVFQGTAEYNARAGTVAAAIRLPGAPLADVLALAQLMGAPAVSGTGTIALDIAVHGPTTSPAFTGETSLRDASLQLAALTAPVGVTSATVRFDGRSAAVAGLNATIAGTRVRGTASVADLAAPAVRFELDADRVDVAAWQRLAAPTSASTSQPTAPSRASSAARSTPPALSAAGHLHLGSLVSQGLELTNVNTQAVFRESQLTLAPLTAQLFDGTQQGRLVADLRPAVPAVSLDLALAGVDTNALLSATSSIKNLLYGALAATGGLRMQLGENDMPGTLNGTLRASIANGRLVGTDILKQLAGVGKFLGYQGHPQSITTILQLGGDVEFTNGLATTKNLQLVMEGGSLAGSGSVNLADRTVDLKATAVLDRAMSQKVGGTGIGGYLSTALSNNKGELVLPITITGTFDKPVFAPDGPRLAEMKLKNLVPGGLTPQGIAGVFGRGAKTGGRSILDALSGNPAQPPPAAAADTAGEPQAVAAPQTDTAAPAAPPSPAQSLLDLFKRKKR